jgi:hypothetical protein
MPTLQYESIKTVGMRDLLMAFRTTTTSLSAQLARHSFHDLFDSNELIWDRRRTLAHFHYPTIIKAGFLRRGWVRHLGTGKEKNLGNIQLEQSKKSRQ